MPLVVGVKLSLGGMVCSRVLGSMMVRRAGTVAWCCASGLNERFRFLIILGCWRCCSHVVANADVVVDLLRVG